MKKYSSTCHWLVTCEHGGNEVPAAFRPYYTGCCRELASHRGFDAGALQAARRLSRSLSAPLLYSRITRLLVDLNRSAHHRLVQGEPVRKLDPAMRAHLMERYYRPYRKEVDQAVAGTIKKTGSVFHLSVHSFTPRWKGQLRNADLGLLYDPRRAEEKKACTQLRDLLRDALPGIRVRMNYPYLGKADGLTTWLRIRYPDPAYCGVELEFNQAALDASGHFPEAWMRALPAALIRIGKVRDVYE